MYKYYLVGIPTTNYIVQPYPSYCFSVRSLLLVVNLHVHNSIFHRVQCSCASALLRLHKCIIQYSIVYMYSVPVFQRFCVYIKVTKEARMRMVTAAVAEGRAAAEKASSLATCAYLTTDMSEPVGVPPLATIWVGSEIIISVHPSEKIPLEAHSIAMPMPSSHTSQEHESLPTSAVH